MSPIIPFITDEIYSNLTNKTQWKKNSVHLEDFPAFNKKNKDDEKLQIATRSAMRLSSLGRSARSKTQIKVRQPINNLLFKTKQQIDPKYLEMIKDQVKDEVNVKNVDIVDKLYKLCETNIKLNKSVLGPKMGNKMEGLIKKINNLDHDLLIKNLQKTNNININDIELSIKDFNIEKHSLKNTEFIEDNNYEVSIDTKLNPSLIDEGSSRELIHNIQNLRKDSGFNISDKIIVTYSSDEYLKNIIDKFESHISQEILATNIIFEKSETGGNAFQINNSNIFISLKISN
jgi:isoleucyl-tRNA synthetase